MECKRSALSPRFSSPAFFFKFIHTFTLFSSLIYIFSSKNKNVCVEVNNLKNIKPKIILTFVLKGFLEIIRKENP